MQFGILNLPLESKTSRFIGVESRPCVFLERFQRVLIALYMQIFGLFGRILLAAIFILILGVPHTDIHSSLLNHLYN